MNDELVGVSIEKFSILCIPCQSCGEITKVLSENLQMDGILKCCKCGGTAVNLMKENGDENTLRD